MAEGRHPFPSRTRPLSPTARMVLLVYPVGEYVAASFTCRKSPSRYIAGDGLFFLWVGGPGRVGPPSGSDYGSTSQGGTAPSIGRRRVASGGPALPGPGYLPWDLTLAVIRWGLCTGPLECLSLTRLEKAIRRLREGT